MFVPLDHARFARTDAAVFTRRVVADCMTHRCTMQASGQLKLDACCQYGADVEVRERDAIRARADHIRPVLRAEVQHAAWFDERALQEDVDGTFVRTAKHDGGCVFLAHDRRGCAIHRAAVEQGWDFRGVKPAVCRLFPLTYSDGAILISDDYPDYSCAYEPGAPTLYRVARDTLGDVFDAALVAAMDAAEARVLATRLQVL